MSAARFAGKTALVTGGNSGIGKAIALGLAAEGARVAVACRNVVTGAAVVDEIARTGGAAMVVRCDVSVPAEVGECARAVAEQFGAVHVLVNAAGDEGNGGAAAITEVDEDEWRALLDVNLGGPYRVARAFIPAMARAGGGAIINISSIGGVDTLARSAPYVAAKTGLVGLTRSMALDYAAHGIRVCSVCPGYVDTELLQRALAKHDNPHKLRLQLTALHPLGRLGQPGDVAPAVLFLASEDARWITGIVLPVDGGHLLRRFPGAPPDLL
jgi:NAD(P)-dependent dehydrogenase (short-subunit alcohol dehydrogenase family)